MKKVVWLFCVVVLLACAVSLSDGRSIFPKNKEIIGKLKQGVQAAADLIRGDDKETDEDGGRDVPDVQTVWNEQKEGHKKGKHSKGHKGGDTEGHEDEHRKGRKAHKEGHKGGHKEGEHKEHKEGHDWEHKGGRNHKGHHKGEHKEGHHWRRMREYFHQRYANLTMHFVEESLSPNVYLVLADKGIEVKAIYEMLGNSTAITKVGVRVAGKNLVVSTNGNLALDGVQSTCKEFEAVELDDGSIKQEWGKLVVTYGPYQIFIKSRSPFSHGREHGRQHGREHGHKNREHRREHKHHDAPLVNHISLRVGVHKSARVAPTGFIGARIAVDPSQYTTPETIV